MKTKTLFICEECETIYDTPEEAMKCEKEHLEPVEIVKCEYHCRGKYASAVSVKFLDGTVYRFIR